MPEAKPASVAYVVLQFDDQLRPKVVDAAPCLHGPYEECEGGSLDAYEDIEVLASSVRTILPQLSDEGSDLYYGRMSGDLTARLDATINAGAAVEAASTAARETCLPDFPPECDGANEELDAALIDLYKIFNAWRDLA